MPRLPLPGCPSPLACLLRLRLCCCDSEPARLLAMPARASGPVFVCDLWEREEVEHEGCDCAVCGDLRAAVDGGARGLR